MCDGDVVVDHSDSSVRIKRGIYIRELLSIYYAMLLYRNDFLLDTLLYQHTTW